MPWLGDNIASFMEGYSWPVVYVVLVVAYVLIHYFFVSQTAQMLALYRRLPQRRFGSWRARCADGLHVAFCHQLLCRHHAARVQCQRHLRCQRVSQDPGNVQIWGCDYGGQYRYLSTVRYRLDYVARLLGAFINKGC